MLMTTLRTAEEVRDVAQMPDVPLTAHGIQRCTRGSSIHRQSSQPWDGW